jgi:hypothetical protein
MAGTHQEFYVRVNIRDPQMRERYEGRAFWSFVRQKNRRSNDSNVSDSELEGVLLTNFGSILKFTSRSMALSGIYFKAKNISYGSLQFSVDVAGFEKLIDLFDQNFDLFLMMLSSFVPNAFEEAFREDYTLKNSLSFDISFPNNFEDEFERPQKKQDNSSSKQHSGLGLLPILHCSYQ